MPVVIPDLIRDPPALYLSAILRGQFRTVRAKEIILPAGMLGGMVGYGWSSLPPATRQSPEQRRQIEQSVHYSGCNEVRAAGNAPLYAGQPGYSEDMDGDLDGIACEASRTF